MEPINEIENLKKLNKISKTFKHIFRKEFINAYENNTRRHLTVTPKKSILAAFCLKMYIRNMQEIH